MREINLVVFLAVILSSCVKDDYNLESAKIKITPEIAAPLLSSNIKASQILDVADSSMFGKNGDSLLEFKYSEKVFSLELSEFIDIPNETIDFKFQLEPLKLENIPTYQTNITFESVIDDDPLLKKQIEDNNLTTSCNVQFPSIPSIRIDPVTFTIDDATFQNVQFSQGKLKVEIKNGWLTPLNGNSPDNGVELQLKNSSNDSVIGTLSYPEILPGDSATEEIDLAGKTVESVIVGNFVSIATDGTTEKTECVSYSDSITLTVNSSDLVIVSGSAVFPNREEVINETVVSSLGLTSGDKLSKIELKSGDLIVKVDYQIEEATKIYIELPYAKLDGGVGPIFKDSIYISPGPTFMNKTFDLAGYTFDLTRGGLDQNSFEAKITGKIESSGSIVNFDTSNSVTAQVIMSEIEPLYIEGYFGSQPLDIPSETFDFDLGESETLEKISFADPTITFGFHSTFGVPMEISSLDLTMKRENDSSTLNSASVFPFKIEGSDSRGNSKYSELVIGSSTNISELINLWPNTVTTSFSGVINPEGETSKNFALDTSKMDVTLDLSVPLYGTVGEFTISDTIDIDLSILEAFEYVKKATLRTHINNGFPLEAAVKFYITDENYLILDSLESADKSDIIINAATVDPNNGEKIANGVKQSDLIVDESDINLLSTVGNKIILKAKLSTANSGNPVKIYSFYEIDLKVGVKAKILFEEEFNLSNN